MEKSYVLWLNPEPWAIGSVHRSSVAPNPGLVAFQSAVRELLADEPKLPDDYHSLKFYFWRQQARYIDAADRVRQRNQADATNMQKALEDALQGVLIDNDRDVREIGAVIVDQGPTVEPCIVIRAWRTPKSLLGYEDFSSDLMAQLEAGPPEYVLKNNWGEDDDPF